MERTRELTTFAIDGYQISATFADSRNTTALGHVKQILLSSFANNAAKHTHGDILAIHPIGAIIIVGVAPMYLEKFISPAY